VGSHLLLQEIFLTQRSNPGLLHCRQILYCLNPQGSPAFKLILFSWHRGDMKESLGMKTWHFQGAELEILVITRLWGMQIGWRVLLYSW